MTGLVFCCKTVVTERLDLLTYLLEMYQLYICSEEDDEEESKKKKKKKNNKDKDRSTITRNGLSNEPSTKVLRCP